MLRRRWIAGDNFVLKDLKSLLVAQIIGINFVQLTAFFPLKSQCELRS